MIELGSKVRDTITGFTGIVTARTTWLNGCSRVGVQSIDLHEGKPIESQWFDEIQVKVLVPRSKREPTLNESTPGGPRADPRPQIGG